VQTLRAHRERPGLLGLLIFHGERGQPLNRSYVRERFLKAQAGHGLPLLRFHDLRHTAATIMFENGENAKAISERLGHSSVAITLDLYGHVTEQVQEDLAARMDEALG
jgi:integrase